MKNTATKKISSLVCIVTLMTVLPGCWLTDKFSKKDETASTTPTTPTDSAAPANAEEVLVSMNGAPIITTKSLDRDFNELLSANPQLKSVLPYMPDAQRNFLMGQISQAIVDKYVADNNLDRDAEYQKEWNRMEHSIKRMLNLKFFNQAHPISISDAEIKKFYDENKDTMPELLISHGGIKSVGISFGSESEAKAFLSKVKGKDLNKVAHDAQLTDKVSDFKLVNKQSLGIDASVRNKIVSFKTFPATELVKASNNSFWVVQATASEEAKYRSFEQVKEGIGQLVKKEKQSEQFEARIKDLKDQYKVIVNEEPLNKATEAKQEAQTAENSAVQSESTQVAEATKAEQATTQVA